MRGGSRLVHVPVAQSGLSCTPTVTVEMIRATLRRKDKTTGSTFISQFVCNFTAWGGGEEEEEKKMLSSNPITGSQLGAATHTNFIQDIRRKGFPIAKVPWQRNFPVAEVANDIFWKWALPETYTWKLEESQPPPGLTAIPPCLDSLNWAHSTSLVGTKERICIGTLKATNISKEREFVPFDMEGRKEISCFAPSHPKKY